jgi:peptide/nickel transport system permease protein
MLMFVFRRTVMVLPTLFGLLVLTFLFTHVFPSDPSAALAGDNATPAQIQEIRRQYGFDRPVYTQFLIYVRQIARGNLGTSIYTQRPVSEDIAHRLPATLELTFVALLIAAGIGIPLGVISGFAYNTWADYLLRVLSVGGLAIASFWLAIMFQLLFSMQLGWLPLRGRLDIGSALPPSLTGFYLLDSLFSGHFGIFWDALKHIVLPAITLAIAALATILRFTRSGVLETLQKDFVTYEIAAGYRRRAIVWKYVLRNSIISAVTQVGLLFSSMIAGAVAVEAIFDWPGIGSYAVGAILGSDYNAMMAVTLIVGVTYAFVNIAVDVLHALIDPRLLEHR